MSSCWLLALSAAPPPAAVHPYVVTLGPLLPGRSSDLAPLETSGGAQGRVLVSGVGDCACLPTEARPPPGRAKGRSTPFSRLPGLARPRPPRSPAQGGGEAERPAPVFSAAPSDLRLPPLLPAWLPGLPFVGIWPSSFCPGPLGVSLGLSWSSFSG